MMDEPIAIAATSRKAGRTGIPVPNFIAPINTKHSVGFVLEAAILAQFTLRARPRKYVTHTSHTDLLYYSPCQLDSPEECASARERVQDWTLKQCEKVPPEGHGNYFSFRL